VKAPATAAPPAPLPDDRWYLAQGDFVYRTADAPVFVDAERVTLIDADGRRYLDAEAANGTAVLGYDPSILEEAVVRGRRLPTLPSFCESSLRLELAERLARMFERATGRRGRIAFEVGGAQGIELAIKIARSNTGGGAFLVFEGGYHGRSGFTSQLSASPRYRRLLGGGAPVVRLPYPDCEQCRFGRTRATCATECVAFTDALLEQETAGVVAGDGRTDVCALVIEPVLNAGGMVFPDPAYLEAVVAQARRRGALIVVDEVFTGLHRTGPMFGFQHYDLEPDLVVLSKALGNGIAPISCVWAREPLAAPTRFAPGTHSTTYANNPLGHAVALTVLDRYQRDDIPARVACLETWLRDALRALAAAHEIVESVTVRGATARLLLRRPLAGAVRAAARRIGHRGYHGLLVASTGMADNVICIHPPLIIDEPDVRAAGVMLGRALAEVAA